MVTNDERRRVAERLRELASDAEEVSDFDLAKTLDLGAVSRYGYDPRDVERLADLIDPDTTTDTTKSPELTAKCDRVALMALADECDEMMSDGYSIGPHEVYRIARRIREACGVAE